VTLNCVMFLTLRYFTEFGKTAFQHITASVHIELINQKSASINHTAVKFAYITKCKDFSVTYFKFIVQVSLYCCSFLCLAFSCDKGRRAVAEFIVFCSTCTILSLKRFTFAISSTDDLLLSTHTTTSSC